MKQIFLLFFLFASALTGVRAQVKKQVLDARIGGVRNPDELLKIESEIKEYKEVVKTYHVFKGPEATACKLVVEVKVDERGERQDIFCSEDLKRIIVKMGFEPLAIKEQTLDVNQEYPNYDK